MRQTVLIVDDNKDTTRLLERLIKSELDMETRSVHRGESALGIIEKSMVHCVIADIKMPGMDGMELLQNIRKKESFLPVIIMTAYGTIDVAVDAMKEGAYDFVTKPFEEELLLHAVRRAVETHGQGRGTLTNHGFRSTGCAGLPLRSSGLHSPTGQPVEPCVVLEHQNLQNINPELEEEISGKEVFFVGETPPIRELIATLRRVARTNVPVLITGETGTGKEFGCPHDSQSQQ